MAAGQSQDYLGEPGSNGDEHGIVDIEASLESLIDGWEDVEEKKFGDVEDGKYQCEIEDAVLEHAKSSGRLQASFKLLIIGGGNPPGSYNGRYIFYRPGLDTEDARGYFRGGLAKLGIPWPENPKLLPETLSGMVGMKCQVTVTTSKSGGQFTHFDKALDDNEIDQTLETDLGTVAPAPARATQPRARVAAPAAGQRQPAAAAPARPTRAAAAPAPAPVEEAPEGENNVTVTFKDDDLTKKLEKIIIAEAGRLDFSPADYKTITDLICDMAEFCGFDGEYDDANVLMAEIAAVEVQPG